MSTTRLVLLALGHHMNADGLAWPTQRTLAKETRLSQRAVSEHLNRADSGGWIVRTEQRNSRGWKLHLCQAAIPELPDIEEVAS